MRERAAQKINTHKNAINSSDAIMPIDIVRDNATGRPAGNVGVSKLSG